MYLWKMDLINNLKKLMDVNIPIIYIHDFDFARVDALVREAIGKARVIEWNPATEVTDFLTKETLEKQSLYSFLLERYQDDFKLERFLVLKEIQDYIDDPQVKSVLELMAQRKLYDRNYETTVIIECSVNRVPDELLKYVSYLDVGFPTDEEIDELIDSHVKVNGYEDSFKERDKEKLRYTLKGMSKFDIDRVLDMAMSSNGTLSVKDEAMILQQKKQMVKKSGVVELIDKPSSIDDIGGLKSLKKYLKNKSTILKDNWLDAHEYGVTMPKGIFLVGMPGCGKSECAKAAATLFNVPLIKLDMGSMMGKYVGESEEKLRQAIRIAEAAAPCVLWIDEIEKAFSGVGGSGGSSDILTRMFGYFLSWLQEKESSVYVIATANDANNLPPELKRKGRFDEIFCVNLPKLEEREEIFQKKIDRLEGKKCFPDIIAIDYKKLAEKTPNFSGADITSVVSEAVERCYLKDKILDEDTLLAVIKQTSSISQTCGEQIDEMRKIFAACGFKDANTGEPSKYESSKVNMGRNEDYEQITRKT